MNYWLVRGSPFENGSFPFVQPNARHQWRTKRPPRSWQVADRLLFWASSPRLELIALGLFEGETGEQTPDNEEIYNVRYLTAVVDSPLTLAELRTDPMLKNANFSKKWPSVLCSPPERARGRASLPTLDFEKSANSRCLARSGKQRYQLCRWQPGGSCHLFDIDRISKECFAIPFRR